MHGSFPAQGKYPAFHWSAGAIATLASLAFYALTPLGRTFGDGLDLGLAIADGSGSHHALFTVLGRGLCALGLDGGSAARLLSALGMALAVGVVAGAWGQRTALLAATSPVLWFFGTTAEVHGLHAFGAVAITAAAFASRGLRPWPRVGLVVVFSALLPLFHPVLVGLAPLVWIAALPSGRWRSALTWLLLLLGPALAVFLAPVSQHLGWVAYLDTTTNIGDLGKALPARVREFGAPAAADYFDFAWEEIAQPFGVLALLGAIGIAVGLVRRHPDALVWIAVLTANAMAFAIIGMRELGGYPIGLLAIFAPAAAALLGWMRAGLGRRADALLAVLVVAQVALALDHRQRYTAEGDDRAFALEIAAALERHPAPSAAPWLLAVRNSRWRQVALLDGPPGVDVRFALDPVPKRMRAATARRMALEAAAFAAAGARVLLDPAILGDGPGLTGVRELRVELETRFDFVSLGGGVIELRPKGQTATK